MSYQSFEDLEVWQRGCRLAVGVFKAFGSCDNYAMRDQVQRAALSIPSNIAEGAERGGTREFVRFLNISKGSSGELRTQLYIARKLDFISSKTFKSLLSESKEISAMLQGLRKSFTAQASAKQKRVRRSKRAASKR
jgi:four helix bundle protein